MMDADEIIFTPELKAMIAKIFDYAPNVLANFATRPESVLDDLECIAGANCHNICHPQRVICAIEGKPYEKSSTVTIDADENRISVTAYMLRKTQAMQLRDMLGLPGETEVFSEELRSGVAAISKNDPDVKKFMSNNKPTNGDFCTLQETIERYGDIVAMDFICEPVRVLCAILDKPYRNFEVGQISNEENRKFVTGHYQRRKEAMIVLEKFDALFAKGIKDTLRDHLPPPLPEIAGRKRVSAYDS